MNRLVSDPIMNLYKTSSFPLIGVLFIGILGATAPCQLSTNLGAIGLITKVGSTKRKLVMNAFWYILGKIIVFTFYGFVIVLLKININNVSIPVFSFVRRFTGIIIIMIGLYIIGAIRLQGTIGNFFIKRSEFFVEKFRGINPSFILGVLFSFAFCPTLFWLFFGMIIPLSLKSTVGLLYPPVFALGTLLPVILVLLFVMISKTDRKVDIQKISKIQKALKIIGGIILIVYGFIDSLIYWFS